MRLFRYKRRIICFILAFATLVWLQIEFHSPEEITFFPKILWGQNKALGVPDILIQHIDKNGVLWATRGYWVYRSLDSIKFKRAFKVPSSSLKAFLGNFRSFRALTGYIELCEVYPLRSGTILIFSGGYIWRSSDNGNTFKKVHRLRHFGVGVGRGVMPYGMTEDGNGIFYYGEYFSNPERDSVFIYGSNDDGKNWGVVNQFKPGEIRHIHSLRHDPFTGALWVTTGDEDRECMIGYSMDKGKGFRIVSLGGQDWRAVSLLFTRDAIFWGTDSPSHQNWIFRWDRRNHNVERICKVDGPIFYSTVLSDGTMIMGRTVEGGRGEWDAMTSIWVSKNGWQWKRMPIGVRKRPKKYAVLRLPRGKSTADIYVTPLNVNRYEQILLKIPAIGISKQRSE